MTADDARKLTDAALAVDSEHVLTVLGLWHAAIKKAADRGRTSVREHECDRVRMPISRAARVTALERLRLAGFWVTTAAAGPNETETEVSWEATGHQPLGRSSTAPTLRT